MSKLSQTPQQNKSSFDSSELKTFTAIIKGFDSGLNELLAGVYYDPRKRRIVNPVKAKNDKCCMDSIRFENPQLRDAKITHPVIIHYFFYCKDKKRDRSNIQAGFIKSFEDALQKLEILPNDSWDWVVGMTTDFDIDAKNPRVAILIEEVERGTKPIFWNR